MSKLTDLVELSPYKERDGMVLVFCADMRERERAVFRRILWLSSVSTAATAVKKVIYWAHTAEAIWADAFVVAFVDPILYWKCSLAILATGTRRNLLNIHLRSAFSHALFAQH